MFEVRVGDANGRVLATFSNKMAADKFAEKQRAMDESAANPLTDGNPATPPPRDPIALAKLIGDIATGQVVDAVACRLGDRPSVGAHARR